MKIQYYLLSLIFFVLGCTTVSIIEKSQLILSSMVVRATSYNQYLAESKISIDILNTVLVKSCRSF